MEWLLTPAASVPLLPACPSGGLEVLPSAVVAFFRTLSFCRTSGFSVLLGGQMAVGLWVIYLALLWRRRRLSRGAEWCH